MLLFHLQELLFERQPAAIAREFAAAAQYPMAGNDKRQGVAGAGQPHGPDSARISDALGDLTVGGCLAVGNRSELIPHGAQKLCALRRKGKREFPQLPGEVPDELPVGLPDRLRFALGCIDRHRVRLKEDVPELPVLFRNADHAYIRVVMEYVHGFPPWSDSRQAVGVVPVISLKRL